MRASFVRKAFVGCCLLSCYLPSAAARASEGVTFSLESGVRETDGVAREWYGSVALVVPFDAIWTPRLSVIDLADGATSGISQATPPVEKSAPPQEQVEPPKPAPPLPPPMTLDSPLVRGAVLVALRVAGYSAARRRLFSLSSRARSSALLPELRLAAGRSTDASLRLTPTLAEPDRYTQTGGSDLWAEARLTWRLDRLLFADEEIAVERLIDERDEGALKLVARVLDVYFAWGRARAQAKDPALLPDERAAADLSRIEAEIALDVMTDGWFGVRVRSRRKGR